MHPYIISLAILYKMPTLPPFEKTAEFMHIRISKDPTIKKIEDFLQFHFDGFVACFETHSNRPHIHVLAKIKYTRSVKIRKLMKEQLEYKGNTDFMVDNVNPEEGNFENISRYVCKGDGPKIPTNVVFRTDNWTDELIELRKEEYWHYEQSRNVVKINLETEEEHVKKPCKKVTNTWTQRLVVELGQEYKVEIKGFGPIPLNEIKWDWADDVHVDFMYDFILKKLGETAKIFDEYQLNKFMYGVFNALDAKNFRDDIKARARSKLNGGILGRTLRFGGTPTG